METSGENRQHEIAASFHALIADDFSPHLDGVCEEPLFRCGFEVFAVGEFEKTVRPGVAMVPVEVAREGVKLAIRNGIAGIFDEHVDAVFVCGRPGRI